jgi:membrane protease YdiL (CAAX protease family)
MGPAPTLPTLVLGLTIWAIIGAMIVAWVWALLQFALRRPLLPSAKLRFVPWRESTAIAIFCFYLFLQLFGPVIVVTLLRRFGHEGRLGSSGMILVQLAISAGFLVLAWSYLVSRTGSTAADLGLTSNHASLQIQRGIVGGLMLVPVAFSLNYAAQKIWKPVPHDLVKVIARGESSTTWVLGAFMAVVMAPIVEEFLFRGVLLGALNRLAAGQSASEIDPELTSQDVVLHPMPDGWSLFTSNAALSLLFGMLHVTFWPTPIPLFFVSLALGAMYQRTGSLIAPIVMHAILNGVSTLLLMLTIMAGFDVPAEPEKPAPIPPPAVKAPLKVTVLNTPRQLQLET